VDIPHAGSKRTSTPPLSFFLLTLTVAPMSDLEKRELAKAGDDSGEKSLVDVSTRHVVQLSGDGVNEAYREKCYLSCVPDHTIVVNLSLINFPLLCSQ
jgi:hypothetical protein